MVKRCMKTLNLTVIAAILLAQLSACTPVNTQSASSNTMATTPAANEPYFPTSFGDFEVPGELRLERKKTLFIKTSSFNGGVVNLSGHVESISLTDFFISSMQKNGWRINGEIRSNNVLLAFNKPNKNCMITIEPGDYGARTQVFVYITENAQGIN